MNELVMRLKAGYSLFWVQTTESTRAWERIQADIAEYVNNDGDPLYSASLWNIEDDQDPESAISGLAEMSPYCITVAINYDWFLQSTEGPNVMIVQMLLNRASMLANKESPKAFIVVSSKPLSDGCPMELIPYFTEVEYGLPTRDELVPVLDTAINTVKGNKKFKMPIPKQREEILNAARGLSLKEAENAIFYSMVKTGGEIDAFIINAMKAETIKNTAGIEYSEYEEDFSTLKGYENLKQFTRMTIPSGKAKGIMLLGPPGTGKSHFAKCLGNEMNLPVLTLEMASLFGGLVGESETNMRKAIQVIKAMTPCIVFVDEIEKGLAGISGGGSNDGGTTKRTMSLWLKFMSDRPDGIYVIATCNDIRSIPPEYLRAERWDTAPFFIDLPSEEERKAILNYYAEIYQVKGVSKVFKNLEGWSGAEIRSLCRIASMMNIRLEKAMDFVIPISTTMDTEIRDLRKWAEGRAIQASPKTTSPTKGNFTRVISL